MSKAKLVFRNKRPPKVALQKSKANARRDFYHESQRRNHTHRPK